MIPGYIWIAIYLCAICLIAAISHALWRDKANPRMMLQGKRILITGGSKGIGLAAAKECFNRGAHVAILARNEEKLAVAAREISPEDPSKIVTISVDVSDFDRLKQEIENAFRAAGWHGLEILFCNAGITRPHIFSTMEASEIQKLINVNVLGTMYTVRACMPLLERAANQLNSSGAQIAFSNSLYGFIGMATNSIYCASKFALRGFAESLDLELREKKIFITNFWFPDVDTPGFRVEATQQAPAIAEIQEGAGIFKPDTVASGIADAFERGQSDCTWGLDGWMLRNLTIGMRPATKLFSSVVQVCLLGLLRIIGMFYSNQFRVTIQKHGRLADFQSSQ